MPGPDCPVSWRSRLEVRRRPHRHGRSFRRRLVAGVGLIVAGTIVADGGRPGRSGAAAATAAGHRAAAAPVAEPVAGIRLNLGKKNKQQIRLPRPLRPPAEASRQPSWNITDYFNRFAHDGRGLHPVRPAWRAVGRRVSTSRGRARSASSTSPPVKLDVISDGKNVSVLNTRTMTQDFYPLNKTPLRYLLADNIDLTAPGLVDEVREEPDLIAVVIVEKSKLVNGKLTLVFDRHSYELKQWIVTDAQGLNTSVAVYNVTTGKKSDPDLFKINYYLSQ